MLLKFFKNFFITIIGAILLNNLAYASCCSSSSSGGVGRLMPHERALFQLNSAASYTLGYFDENYSFIHSKSKHHPYLGFDQELQIMARLGRYFLPFVKVGTRIQLSAQQSGANMNDSVVGARIPVLPALSVISSWKMPTGMSSGQNDEYRPEYLTSMGQHWLNLAVFWEKNINNLTLGCGYNLSLQPPFIKRDIYEGQSHAAIFSLSLPLSESSFIGSSISPVFVTPMYMNQEKIPHSAKHKIGLALSYTKKIHSHISLLASMGSDVPLSYLGANMKSEAFANIGLRFGVF